MCMLTGPCGEWVVFAIRDMLLVASIVFEIVLVETPRAC